MSQRDRRKAQAPARRGRKEVAGGRMKPDGRASRREMGQGSSRHILGGWLMRKGRACLAEERGVRHASGYRAAHSRGTARQELLELALLGARLYSAVGPACPRASEWLRARVGVLLSQRTRSSMQHGSSNPRTRTRKTRQDVTASVGALMTS